MLTPTQETIRNLLVAATLIPLASATVMISLTCKVLFKKAGWFATGLMAVSFACSLIAGYLWMTTPEPKPVVWNLPWIPIPGTEAGWLYLGLAADALTIAMMMMVCGIALLVHLYSVGYMEGDKRFNLFFAYLSLFTFSMLGIVISNSLIMLFVFWELVGLTSYLLIGFWFEKKGPQLACKKAFVMNRIGDMGFLIGMGILFYHLGGKLLLPATQADANIFSAVLAELHNQNPDFSILNPPMWLTCAGIGLFFGAIGKSAQFPLHTWLPDAMEGPTPVSSIVHSATMVAAGVYLTGRIYPILTPSAHMFVATIGLITLVIAACMALVMTDIKRVLAYSTLSQLGYMILGLGSGAWGFALFHLITHAFFKCCLFQCAGSVIHAAHHQQDMRYYGGLWRKMPVTAACYLICTLAIAGASIPLTGIGISGFYSKDGIIAGTYNYGQAMAAQGWSAGHLFYWGPTIVAYLTVFYMGRSFALTFLGKPRDQHLHDNAHEAPWQMVVPQVVLAVMAVVSAPWIMDMWISLINKAGEPMMEAMESAGGAGAVWMQSGHEADHHIEHAMHFVHGKLLYGFAWIIMLGAAAALYMPGLGLASKIAAAPGIRLIHTWFINKFYFDSLYDVFVVALGKSFAVICSSFDKYIVDGLVKLAGLTTKALAWISGLFDLNVVDGLVNGAANMAQNGGRILRTTQAGRVRVYVLLVVCSAVLTTLAVIIAVMVNT